MPLGFVCELTPKCNLDCSFCYNVWNSQDTELPQGISLDQWNTIIDRLHTIPGVEWLAFTGGEPLLFPDLERLIFDVKSRHPSLKIGLSTNGTLLTQEKLENLVESGISHVEIPLFTLEDARYQKLTSKNKIQSVKEAITWITQAPVTLTIAVTLLPGNVDSLDSVLEYAFAMSADKIYLNRFIPTGRGASWNLSPLPDEDLRAQLEKANGFATRNFTTIDVTIPVEDCLIAHERFPNLEFHPCLCGSQKWAVDPNGNLRTCEQNHEILGNVLTQSIRDVIQNQRAADFALKTLKDECADCSKWQICRGGCRFRAIETDCS